MTLKNKERSLRLLEIAEEKEPEILTQEEVRQALLQLPNFWVDRFIAALPERKRKPIEEAYKKLIKN